jgi:F-type H+-transporting ATPase subunit delta
MKTKKQTQHEARRLFRLCLVNGALDEDRVRDVVQRVIAAGRPGSLNVLARFQRLVRLDRVAHTARVESTTPLPGEVRTSIESSIARLHGAGIVTTYAANSELLGGARITVGSDVYDSSIEGRLAELEARL